MVCLLQSRLPELFQPGSKPACHQPSGGWITVLPFFGGGGGGGWGQVLLLTQGNGGSVFQPNIKSNSLGLSTHTYPMTDVRVAERLPSLLVSEWEAHTHPRTHTHKHPNIVFTNTHTHTCSQHTSTRIHVFLDLSGNSSMRSFLNVFICFKNNISSS